MDWLEEKAEQFRKYLQNTSLIKSMAGYFLVSLTGACCCLLFTRNLCARWLFALLGDHLNYSVLMGLPTLDILRTDRLEIGTTVKAVVFVYRYSFICYLILAFAAAGRLFIRQKINPMVEAVREAMGYISAGDYSHEISYHSKDEIGDVCRNFDEMRKLLIAEKRQEWNEQEAQRRINAAFAHDMRTPLTVIKGYTEFLQKYVPQGKVSEQILLEKLATMQMHEERLLAFSGTMTTVQNIEKWEVKSRWVRTDVLTEMLKGTISGMAEGTGKRVFFHAEGSLPGELLADLELICEVFDNVLGNALRYARECIDVQLEIKGSQIQIFVKDDGDGFSSRALRKALEVYYSEAEGNGTHFGIGLSICQMLCERHGGSLVIVNSVEGGAIVCPVFGVMIR